jgi:hypothetical protein
VSGIDYAKLKLFFLSILWRAHISEHKFFKDVNLDKRNEIEIKQMLLENDSKSEKEYKIGMIAFQNSVNQLIPLLLNPTVKTIGTGKVGIFFINGYCYFIDLKPNSSLKIFDKVYISKAGTIDVPIVHGEMAISLLVSLGVNFDIAKNYAI